VFVGNPRLFHSKLFTVGWSVGPDAALICYNAICAVVRGVVDASIMAFNTQQ